MKYIPYLIVGAICLATGWFAGYFGPLWLHLELKKEVSLIELLQLGFAIIFAFALQNYLVKRFGDQRSEKEHMIDLIKELIVMLKEVRTCFITRYQRKRIAESDRREILNSLRNLANGIETFKKCMSDCGYAKEDDPKVKSLSANYFELKGTITGGEFPSKPYSGETFSDAEKIFSQISSDLHLLRIQLNKK